MEADPTFCRKFGILPRSSAQNGAKAKFGQALYTLENRAGLSNEYVSERSDEQLLESYRPNDADDYNESISDRLIERLCGVLRAEQHLLNDRLVHVMGETMDKHIGRLQELQSPGRIKVSSTPLCGEISDDLVHLLPCMADSGAAEYSCVPSESMAALNSCASEASKDMPVHESIRQSRLAKQLSIDESQGLQTDKSASSESKKAGLQVQPANSVRQVCDSARQKTYKHQVFMDEASMKNKVVEALHKPVYNVQEFYQEEGFCQSVARSPTFDAVTMCMIVINSLWIAVDADNNDADLLSDAHPVFQVAENIFCVFFLGELLIRFGAFKKKTNCLKDTWFWFDSVLVVIMVMETWVVTLIFMSLEDGSSLSNTSMLKVMRGFRMARASRMVRLLRNVPELMVLLKGVIAASKTVFFTGLLIIIATYGFAIVFRQLTADTDTGSLYFPSVYGAMQHLLIAGCFPDLEDTINGLESPVIVAAFILYIILATFTLLNMLMGIMIDVIVVIASVEKEELTVSYVRQVMTDMFEHMGDADGDGEITYEEFQSLLLNPEVVNFLNEIGVDAAFLVEFTKVIFKNTQAFKYAELISLMLDLRGQNPTLISHLIKLQKWMDFELCSIEHRMLEAVTGIEKAMPRFGPQVLPCPPAYPPPVLLHPAGH